MAQRYRLLHCAARLAFHARRGLLRLPRSWPWAGELAAAFARLAALPARFAFVLDAFSRRIVGWQFAAHMRTDLVLDALRMALAGRGPGADVELVHHSDRGSQGGEPGRV